MHNGQETYGGTSLGIFHNRSLINEELVRDRFDISPTLKNLGMRALAIYDTIAISSGRVSVDVVEGITDNGKLIQSVIDITPRVGGTTPAEILAISEIYKNPNATCFASSKLIYNPTSKPTNGVNFVDTNTLIINAQIHEVIK